MVLTSVWFPIHDASGSGTVIQRFLGQTRMLTVVRCVLSEEDMQ